MIRLTTIVVLAATIVGCTTSDDMVVAMVDGEPILAQDFSGSYVDYLGRTGLPDTAVRREGFLQQLIGKRLIVADARATGLTETDAFLDYSVRATQKAEIEAWLHHSVYDTIAVSDGEILDLFERVNTRLTARHLYSNSREEADALYDRLMAGESFEDLAAEIFTDPHLQESGGLIGTFGFDEMDPGFEDAAYALSVSEVSRPVRTSQGYSIIRVDDRETTPLLTENAFAERLPALHEYLLDRRQLRAREQISESIIGNSEIQIGASVAARMVIFNQGLTLPGAESGAPDGDEELVRFLADGQPVSWTVDDFRTRARLLSEQQRAQMDRPDGLEAVVRGLVVREIMLQRAASVSGHDDLVASIVASAEGDWLYEARYEQIMTVMAIPEDSLRAVYDSAEGNFMLPERVRLAEIVVSRRALADSLIRAMSGTTFGSLAARYSERPASAANFGDVGFQSRDALGPWADPLFGARSGTVVGPLEAGGRYHIFLVGSRDLPRPASYEEARFSIEKQIRVRDRRAYLRTVVGGLRDLYPVEPGAGSVVDLPLDSSSISSVSS